MLAFVSAFLGALFLIIIIAVQVVSSVYTDNYVKHNVYMQQSNFDQSINTLLINTNSNLIKLFSNENISEIDKSNENSKNEVLIAQYTELSLSDELYDGVSLYHNDSLIAETEKMTYIEKKQRDLVINSTENLVYIDTVEHNGTNNLIFGKKINDNYLGFIHVKEQVVLDFLSNILSSGYSLLIANDNHIVSDQKSELSGSYLYESNTFKTSNGRKYSVKKINDVKSLIIVEDMNNINSSFALSWKVASIIPYSELFYLLDVFRYILIATAIVMLSISIVISIKASSSVAKPIKNLADKVDNFNPEKPEEYVLKNEVKKVSTKDEIYMLEESYDAMIERIYELMEKNIKDMDEKRRLELDSLQQQINPHFLYNTLDAIAWMAKIKKELEIEKLVMSLAKFFRISLHRGDTIITVGEEIELTQHYLEIQEIRFPNRFDITYDIDPNVKNYKTLKLLLQPVVENAIKYGMQEQSGTIVISVKKIDENIVYSVKDNGEGFDVPKDMLSRPYGTMQENRSGYGLFNINERIRLEYGAGYGLKIDSEKGKGTIVYITIPIKK